MVANPNNPELSVLMVAGETSADIHGAMVVKEMRQHNPAVHITGIGGPHMIKQGFVPLAHSSEISVMGITEVLKKLFSIYRIAQRLVDFAKKNKPKAAILIDLPDFNLRLAKKLKKLNIPIIYYISPQIWAWRKNRIKQIKKYVDTMLVILPFEEEFYQSAGVQAHFVGHPLVEELETEQLNQEQARSKLALPQQTGPIVAILPGSRKAEIKRHLPLLLQCSRLIKEQLPQASFILPIASQDLKQEVEIMLQESSTAITLIDGDATTALCASDVAAVCSGTATLQTALLGIPMVIFYKLSWLSYHILRRFVTVPYIALVNLIAQKLLAKELIQKDFTANTLAKQLLSLLQNKQLYGSQKKELLQLKAQLGSKKASQEVSQHIAPYIDIT